MPEDYSDLFQNDLPFKDRIRRFSYRPDVSGYTKDQEIEAPLVTETKGFMVNEKPQTQERLKGMELKEDIEAVAESVDRGYSDLDRATKIKVFKELLKEYKDPIIARSKFSEMIRRSFVSDEIKPVVSPELKNRVVALLAKYQKDQPEDFDLDEFVLFASALERDPSLQDRTFVVRDSKRLDKTTTSYIKDLKKAGFTFPEGMERVGETKGNFVKYLSNKYGSVYNIIKQSALEEKENMLNLLKSIQEDAFGDAMDSFLSTDSIPKKAVGFRRLF